MAATPEAAAAADTVVQVRRTFAAPRERVFRAWTDPEQFGHWVGRGIGAEADVRVGGEFRISMSSPTLRLLARLPGPYTETIRMVGRYLEINPPERLVFSVGWEDVPMIDMDEEASRVTVEFHERGADTEVVLTHERLPTRRLRAWHRYGWGLSLRNLEKVLRETEAGS
jgi:uncharacterized protein YndB with AHSA1/START domain